MAALSTNPTKMIELQSLKFPSTNVHSAGFEGEARGNLYVQFKDKNDALTQLGYYRDVQRAIFNALMVDRKPGQFIHQNLKNRFEWIPLEAEVAPEIQEMIDNPLPLKDDLYIPANVENTSDAIDACLASQQTEPVTKGLFR